MEALFRQEVKSDCRHLQELHLQFAWIPGEASIRPSDAVKAVKLETLLDVEANWVSFADYLLCTVFGKPKAKNGAGKFYSADREVSEVDMVLQPNEYPYDNIQCNHWIMWYGCQYRPYDSAKISSDIEEKLGRHLSDSQRFDFVWYENPKMSLPEFFHVHVFWIQLD
ncbi:hypothetical protein EON65_10995 [archaeon]|nr:MAG: hypothetical protein EON65_10995 [archaeon]